MHRNADRTQQAGNYPNYDDDILLDWSRKSLLNLVNAGWLFKNQSVDYLIETE